MRVAADEPDDLRPHGPPRVLGLPDAGALASIPSGYVKGAARSGLLSLIARDSSPICTP